MLSRIALPLLLVVALGGCVSQGTYNQEVQQVDMLSAQNKTYQTLNAQLQNEVKADEVRIKQLQGRLTITMIDEVVFSSGSAEMNAKGRATLEKIVGTLQGTSDKRIVVRGYTDNEPIGAHLRGRYPSNWELSTARATEVLKWLVEAGGLPEQRLSAAGFGPFRPRTPNTSSEARARNRRVDLIVVSPGGAPAPRAGGH